MSKFLRTALAQALKKDKSREFVGPAPVYTPSPQEGTPTVNQAPRKRLWAGIEPPGPSLKGGSEG